METREAKEVWGHICIRAEWGEAGEMRLTDRQRWGWDALGVPCKGLWTLGWRDWGGAGRILSSKGPGGSSQGQSRGLVLRGQAEV